MFLRVNQKRLGSTLVTIYCFVFSAKSSSDEMPNNPMEPNLLGPGVVNSEPIAPIQIKTEVISPTKPAMKAEVISPTKLVIKTEATSPTKLTIKTEVISPTHPADIETFPSPSQPDQSFNSSITGTILGSEFFSPGGPKFLRPHRMRVQNIFFNNEWGNSAI